VGFMNSNYKCFIDIRFSGGDIQIDVSSDTQLFSFKSGIGFIAIPNFFQRLPLYIKAKLVKPKLIVMETLITIYFPVMVQDFLLNIMVIIQKVYLNTNSI